MDYFECQVHLQKIEREEDLRLYQNLNQAASAAERRQIGLSWYPVAIRNTEIGRGDYLILELERTTHQDLSHQFRFGSSVTFFSNHDAREECLEGVVNFVGGNKMKISFKTDELPDWTRQGKLGINLLFDNYSYDEMQEALKQAAQLVKGNDPLKKQLISVLTGTMPASFQSAEANYIIPALNEKQQQAVKKILNANELAIVHGPPGTGKTTTIVQAIKALNREDKRQILVVAPSNTAVDLLTEKLADEGLEVLRIGNPARVSEKMNQLTLDRRLADHADNKSIKKLKKQAAEFKQMAHKYKRNFGRAEQEQRKALFNEAHKIMKEADLMEQHITDQLISQAEVITATLVGANHYTIRNLKFTTVVIDEAGQALEPACWIPALKAERLILAGDHLQLSPTIKSAEAAKKGLSKTLLEKLAALHPEAVVLLEEQYRMHEEIMAYSSKVFYADLLRAHHTVGKKTLFPDDQPVLFIDTAGCGFDEKTEGTSIVNPEEAAFLIGHLSEYIEELKAHYDSESFPEIGIIAPYQEQVKILRELLQNSQIGQDYLKKISINTVDSFQGQEREIIYLSLTRSNTEQLIGFLSDIRRMNVAMTRAKMKLVVIGDSATLSRLPFYSDFVTFADEKNGYHSAWNLSDSAKINAKTF